MATPRARVTRGVFMAFYGTPTGDRLLALRRRLAIEQVAIGFAIIGSIVGVATAPQQPEVDKWPVSDVSVD